MNINQLISVLALSVLLMVACEKNNSVDQQAADIGLPKVLASKAVALPKGNGVKVTVSINDIQALKRELTLFDSWNKLDSGSVIESGGFKMSGENGHQIEYSIGGSAEGILRVLVYDHTAEELYALYVDGIM
ncbi:MAG: hypothetical protein D3920_13210 [Candidatus Electrothrix sp. AW2]|nr:hypothetical protein [Candidatus Electrothrix gigas]